MGGVGYIILRLHSCYCIRMEDKSLGYKGTYNIVAASETLAESFYYVNYRSSIIASKVSQIFSVMKS